MGSAALKDQSTGRGFIMRKQPPSLDTLLQGVPIGTLRSVEAKLFILIST
jgi:hypothetical protein